MSKRQPFSHQQETFHIVAELRRAVYMIAGTAAGKTLAIALPLFHLLRQGEIRHVLFMYPTLALLDDQRRVMEKLARMTGLEVAEVRGGMRRQDLIAALNCPVILATPDAVYWFFRKNVKYSSLLIYGLAQIDVFVLDEAHLFAGLTLRNLKILKERIQALAAQLNRHPQWHVLTATPHEELEALTTEGIWVEGKSKCGDIGLDLLDPQETMRAGREQMKAQVDKVLEAGAQKVLLVFNSAAEAHATFRSHEGDVPAIPARLRSKYGRVWLTSFKDWMTKYGLDPAAVNDVKVAIHGNRYVSLHDMDRVGLLTLASDTVIAAVTDLLEIQSEGLATALARSDRGGRLAQLLQDEAGVQSSMEVDAAQQVLDQWLTARITDLEERWSDSEMTVSTPGAQELLNGLVASGFSDALSKELHKRLCYRIKVGPQEIRRWGYLPRSLRQNRVMLNWAVQQVQDADERDYLEDMLSDAVASSRLEIELPNTGSWGDSRVPVILYSGKMAKDERVGQLRLFNELERAVLVSTSAVEVGVDFDADVLITEDCPGPSLLQRFGRIGRQKGSRGRVILQVHNHAAFAEVRQALAYSDELSREAFSKLIMEVFPPRRYLSGSIFLDATHWLVNEQIGRIGKLINEKIFPGEVAELARQLRAADLALAFGLRGTMPQVSLVHGITIDPFYGLSKIENRHLLPPDSPFEMAQATMSYTEFIYKPSEWRIGVDWKQTLEQSRALFFLHEGKWRIVTGNGIAGAYVETLNKRGRVAVQQILSRLDKQPELIGEIQEKHPTHPVARIGDALWHQKTNRRPLVLGYGDLYLERRHREEQITESVTDFFGETLNVPDQVWLLIIGDTSEIERQIDALGFADVEEVIPDVTGKNVVLVERMVGACFDVYDKWERLSDVEKAI